MRGSKITLEEHFALPEFVEGARPEMRKRLLDLQGTLIADMDEAGIETSVLSFNAPGVQGLPDRCRAIEAARISNDYLAEQVSRNPRRLQGFAAVALQDPESACRELHRCVKELNFKGVLVNGFSQIDTEQSSYYYDLPQFSDFWKTVESLGVPFYLHPRDPLQGAIQILDGHPWLMSSRFAFTIETCCHALRLMASGLFDRCPKLQIVLGHLGETLANQIWRIDHRIELMPPKGIPAKCKLDHYLRNNFYFTTSGNFCTLTLMNAVQWMGVDRILFSVDYPFERMTEAAGWFDGLDVLNPTEWDRIASGNAERLLKLEAAKAQAATC